MKTSAHKYLTYLLLIAMSVLPVQIASASIAVVEVEQNSVASTSECPHHVKQAKQQDTLLGHACCDESAQQCDHCPSSMSFVMIPVKGYDNKVFSLKQHYLQIQTTLYGFSQSNLLRPPQLS